MMMMMRCNQCAFAKIILWVLVVPQAFLLPGDFMGSYGDTSRDKNETQPLLWFWNKSSSLSHRVSLLATSSQPHMAWHNYDPWTRNHSWHPSWIGSTSTTGTNKPNKRRTLDQSMNKEQRLQLIEDSFLRNNHPHNPTHTHTHIQHPIESQVMLPPLEMLGFIRIPKTGSTAMLTWAESATRQGPYWSCFFASRRHDIFNKTDGLSSHFWNGGNVLDCSHRTYEATVMKWATTILPTLNLLPTDTAPDRFSTQQQQQQQQQQVSLQLFTILRDPFDRLVSYFHYVRRIYPAWSYASTPEQNATILANNLTGWMELLAAQPPKAFHLPYQKGAMMDIQNLSRAIQMIQSPTPRVYTVIQECFEGSVLLLTEKFPQFFSLSATTEFLNSSKTKQNSKGKFQKVQQDTLTKLKEQAKIWFAADFQFYDEAVQQFSRQLIASNIDPAIVQECLHRLQKPPQR